MKKLEYQTTTTSIRVLVDDKLWQTWPRNETTEAIAAGLISPPANLNEAFP